MKIENIKDVDKFFEIIEQCKGKVEIISKEGDRLNAKFVIASKFFEHPIINELELIAENPDDRKLLIQFMMNGN